MKRGDPAKLPPLLIEQVERLLERAITLLNRYAYMFETTLYATQPVGHDHIERIFAMMQSDLDRRAQLIQKQLAQVSLDAHEEPDRMD